MSRFDKVINRKQTDSVKWDYTKKIFGVENVLPMWVADMDFSVPEEVTAALHSRVDHGIFGYTMPGTNMEKAVQSWLKKRHSWEIDTQTITYSPGIVTAISLAIHAFTSHDEKIVVQPPVYYPFFEIAQKHEREVLFNKLILNEDFRYEIDYDDLEAKLSDEKTKLFILCNPHNPSGRVWSREELTKIGDLCIKHNVTIISDDIHSDLLLFGNSYTPIASIREDIAKQTVTCIAPSKTFNLAGLQASLVLIPNDSLKRRYHDVQQLFGLLSINTLGADAMEAAYSYGERWLDELLPYLEENVVIIEDYLKEHLPEVKVMRPEATYLVWLDARSLNKTDKELQELLLKKGKVALHIGSKFWENGEGFLRMNIACPKSTIIEGMERLVTALKA
ncbi:MalY/PatB family protein [Metabacillus halosaccharovorans]|uniref:cysteine-S-conjugate beta-lyase n=1 Tax=Metabacillus halosaccharovorans TaxID=930124 RepID=A0ABT3DIM8_9BACI|nr:MalY/PatB family protein [Metabacillus halosaccharovorans]MCV9886912.1 pyridoxal phosphate-dependent aminotransferase [Metabacillus halosaccharovorans]